MTDHHPTAEEQDDPVGQALRAAEAAMDDLMVLANRSETKPRIFEEKRAIGQIFTQCQLLASFALADKPAPTHIRRVS